MLPHCGFSVVDCPCAVIASALQSPVAALQRTEVAVNQLAIIIIQFLNCVQQNLHKILFAWLAQRHYFPSICGIRCGFTGLQWALWIVPIRAALHLCSAITAFFSVCRGKWSTVCRWWTSFLFSSLQRRGSHWPRCCDWECAGLLLGLQRLRVQGAYYTSYLWTVLRK